MHILYVSSVLLFTVLQLYKYCLIQSLHLISGRVLKQMSKGNMINHMHWGRPMNGLHLSCLHFNRLPKLPLLLKISDQNQVFSNMQGLGRAA